MDLDDTVEFIYDDDGMPIPVPRKRIESSPIDTLPQILTERSNAQPETISREGNRKKRKKKKRHKSHKRDKRRPLSMDPFESASHPNESLVMDEDPISQAQLEEERQERKRERRRRRHQSEREISKQPIDFPPIMERTLSLNDLLVKPSSEAIKYPLQNELDHPIHPVDSSMPTRNINHSLESEEFKSRGIPSSEIKTHKEALTALKQSFTKSNHSQNSLLKTALTGEKSVESLSRPSPIGRNPISSADAASVKTKGTDRKNSTVSKNSSKLVKTSKELVTPTNHGSHNFPNQEEPLRIQIPPETESIPPTPLYRSISLNKLTNQVTCRVLDNRQVIFWYAQDVELFDIAREYKSRCPDKNEDILLSELGDRATAGSLDAIARILYRQEYDYILKYDPEDNRQSVRSAFEIGMLKAGLFLETNVSSREEGGYVYLKVIAPFHVMCRVAEVYGLQLALKRPVSLVPVEAQQKVNGSPLFGTAFLPTEEQVDLNNQFEAFKRTEYYKFRGLDTHLPTGVAQSKFFKSIHKSLLIHFLIESIRVKYNSVPGFQTQNISYFLSVGIYLKFYLTHERLSGKIDFLPTLRDHLIKNWTVQFWKRQHLEDLKEYFGEKIGFYFTFIRYYRNWTLVHAGVGCVVFFYGVAKLAKQSYSSRSWSILYDNELTFWFAIFNSLFAMFFVSIWRRKAVYLSFLWATSDSFAVEKQRHPFRPSTTKPSPVTGEEEPYYPPYKRLGRQCISWLVNLVCYGLVILTVMAQITLGQRIKGERGNSDLASAVNSLMGCFFIVLLRYLYTPLAIWLNNWENHETEKQYKMSLDFKRWTFDFVNLFSRLIYFGLFRAYFNQSIMLNDPYYAYPCDGQCNTDLFIQFCCILLFDSWFTLCQHSIIPIVRFIKENGKEDGKVYPLANDIEKNLVNSQYLLDDLLPPAPKETLDLLPTVLQFCLLCSFSIIFPLGSLFVMSGATAKMHLDAFMLLKMYQRPPPEQARDIDISENYLTFAALFASAMNACLVVFATSSFQDHFLAPNWPAQDWLAVRFGVLAGWFFGMLLFMHILHGILPKTPRSLIIAKERRHYLEGIAFYKDLIQ